MSSDQVPVPRRPPGSIGRVIQVTANMFPVTIPRGEFYHYDGERLSLIQLLLYLVAAPSPFYDLTIIYSRVYTHDLCNPPVIVPILSEITKPRAPPPAPGGEPEPPEGRHPLPARRHLEIIDYLQTMLEPNLFTPRGIYDGKKNFFITRELGDKRKFVVSLGSSPRGGKSFEVKMDLVARVDTSVLHRVVAGQATGKEGISAVTCLNVAVRMVPIMKWPFDNKSFFTPKGKKSLSSGLEIWRGFFQSVRPTIGKMVVNIDVATGIMYQDGTLLDLCIAVLNVREVRALAPGALTPRQLHQLKTFLRGVRVLASHSKPGRPPPRSRPQTVRGVSMETANSHMFSKDGEMISINTYFMRQYNIHLRFPDLITVQLGGPGSEALVPLELLNVVPGTIYRGKIPPEITKDVLQFMDQRPEKRLETILSGIQDMEYQNSDYMVQTGMRVESTPVRVSGRVLPPPELVFGGGQPGRENLLTPVNGVWNLRGKLLYQAFAVRAWAVVIYERGMTLDVAKQFVTNLTAALGRLGVRVANAQPPLFPENGSGPIAEHLERASRAACERVKHIPELANMKKADLILVILPFPAMDIKKQVKRWGDVDYGVATQCVIAPKVTMANLQAQKNNDQYVNNVVLKINAKLGGLNAITTLPSIQWIGQRRTMVVGADVSHPPPSRKPPPKGKPSPRQKLTGPPSISALVASVNRQASFYVATSEVQAPKEEIIADMEKMMKYAFDMFYDKNKMWPEQILFYRDGVGEGQFAEVALKEISAIKSAARLCGIEPLPTITFIIVGKRHHVRFFPDHANRDNTGNCPPGLVVDTGITHPSDLDFYLQSHSGLKGTSRPAHYSVLMDENRLSVDTLQQLSYALCYIYARATRSVSIPAPVYYADIVCTRSRYHFDEQFGDASEWNGSEGPGGNPSEWTLDQWKAGYKPLHLDTSRKMYFM